MAAQYVLSATFLVAAIGKIRNRQGTIDAARGFGLPPRWAPAVARIVWAAELMVAVGLVVPQSARASAVAACLLLATFTGAMGAALARGERPACNCFGRGSRPIGLHSLARNAVLGVLAVALAIDMPPLPFVDTIADVARRGAPIVVPVAVAVVVVQSWLLFVVLRRYGAVLMQLESENGAGHVREPGGPPVGSVAPAFDATTSTGEAVSIASLLATHQKVVLVFTDTSCTVCDELYPQLVRWEGEHGSRVAVVLISRGELGGSKRLPSRVVVQRDRELIDLFRVRGTPSVILIGNDGLIDRPVAEGPEPITSLLRSLEPPATLVPAPRRRIDSRSSPDMPARLDLAELDERFTGKPLVLVFFDPSCQYCQQLLPDLERWEQGRDDAAPAIALVTPRPMPAGQAEKLSCHVIPDPPGDLAREFGVEASPSAVRIARNGRTASDVAVGGHAVLDLLKASDQGLVIR